MKPRSQWKALAVLPALLLFSVDQLIKRWGIHHLLPRERRAVLGSKSMVLCMYYNHLPGGRLTGSWSRFGLPCLLWLALLGTASLRFRRATGPERVGYACLLAGGASNLWDQWRLHALVDTFQVLLSDQRFLPFNLADLTVSLSATALACLLGYRMLRDARLARNPALPFSSRAFLRR